MRLGRFEGVVVDPDDVPIEGAVIELTESSGKQRGLTDSAGHFSVGVREGEWSLDVSAPGYVSPPGNARYFAVAGTVVSGLRFVLKPSRVAKGRVVDEQGAPVAYASIALGSDMLNFTQPELARTDSSGSFSTELPLKIDRLENQLVVFHECCFEHRETLAEGSPALEFTIRLRKVTFASSAFRGLVVDAAGAPVRGAIVSGYGWLRLDGGVVSRHQSSTSRADGHFSLVLPDENAFASAWMPDGRSSEQVPLLRGVANRIVLGAPSECVISGLVTDEAGTPIKKYQLELQRKSGEMEQWVPIVTGDGRFQLVGVEAGSKALELTGDDFAAPPLRRFTLDAGERRAGLDFVVSRGRTVRGTVVDEQSGKWIADAGVFASSRWARTDARGQFTLARLPLSPVEVEAERDGYARRFVHVGTDTNAPITIRLRVTVDGGSEQDYEGIGLLFENELDAGAYRVLRVHPQGGARLAGIQEGDEILGVEGVRAESVEYRDFISHARGPADTVVKLSVRRDGREFEVSAVRRQLTW